VRGLKGARGPRSAVSGASTATASRIRPMSRLIFSALCLAARPPAAMAAMTSGSLNIPSAAERD
jgi:hypothetical protein